MSLSQPGQDAASRDLQTLLTREFAQAERPMRHAEQRLQPVVLPPPPTSRAATADVVGSVTHDDDIDLDVDDDAAQRRWQLMLAAIGVGIAGVGLIVWIVHSSILGSSEPASAALPRPAPAVPLPDQPPVAAAPAAVAPAAPPPTDVSMADVTTDLVPPSTEGLSPARKVNTIRIIVENDREIARAP